MTSPDSSAPMRIGIDLGGTKIEVAALDADGRERLRRRIRDAAHDYEAIVDGGRAASSPTPRRELGAPGTGRHRHAGRDLARHRPVKNANSTWLNGSPCATTSQRALGARGAHRQRRELLRALRGASTAPAAGADVVFGVILGTGVGGGIVVDGRVLDGRHAHRRRVGPQPAAVARTSAAAGPPATAAGAAASRPSSPAPASPPTTPRDTAAPLDAPRTIVVRRAPASGDGRPAEATLERYATAWPARSRASSTCSIPTSSCSAAAVEHRPLYAEVPRGCRATCSPTADDAVVRAGTAIRAASAARPGSGRRGERYRHRRHVTWPAWAPRVAGAHQHDAGEHADGAADVHRLQALVEERDRLQAPNSGIRLTNRPARSGPSPRPVRPQQEAGLRREDDDVDERTGEPGRHHEWCRLRRQRDDAEQQHQRRHDAGGEHDVRRELARPPVQAQR